MDPRKIAQGYDAIADHWASDRFPSSNGIAQHQRALEFLQGRNRALDIGCGANGRIIDLLLEQGFAVEGVDISERMLTLAKQRHQKVEFHLADICQWTIPGKYDFISAWDSIWHVPLAHHERVLAEIMNSLTPGGIFIFTMGGVDSPSEKTDSFMGPEMYYSTLGVPATLALISPCGCVCRHLEYDQYPELHLYMIVQKE